MDKNEKILAKAILELAEKTTYSWDYNGEQCLSTGIILDCESELKEIAQRENNQQSL